MLLRHPCSGIKRGSEIGSAYADLWSDSTKFHVNQSDGVSEYPSDWNCHPDTNLTDIVGEEIDEGNACSQGYHGQDNGHAGFFDCAVISVQKKKEWRKRPEIPEES